MALIAMSGARLWRCFSRVVHRRTRPTNAQLKTPGETRIPDHNPQVRKPPDTAASLSFTLRLVHAHPRRDVCSF